MYPANAHQFIQFNNLLIDVNFLAFSKTDTRISEYLKYTKLSSSFWCLNIKITYVAEYYYNMFTEFINISYKYLHTHGIHIS